jgi:hypothetical protein
MLDEQYFEVRTTPETHNMGTDVMHVNIKQFFSLVICRKTTRHSCRKYILEFKLNSKNERASEYRHVKFGKNTDYKMLTKSLLNAAHKQRLNFWKK